MEWITLSDKVPKEKGEYHAKRGDKRGMLSVEDTCMWFSYKSGGTRYEYSGSPFSLSEIQWLEEDAPPPTQ